MTKFVGFELHIQPTQLVREITGKIRKSIFHISIYQFMRITNCLNDLCFILAVLKHKYLIITAT